MKRAWPYDIGGITWETKTKFEEKKLTNEKVDNSKTGKWNSTSSSKANFFFNHIYKLKSFVHVFYHNSIQNKKKSKSWSQQSKETLSQSQYRMSRIQQNTCYSVKATYTYALRKVFCCVFFTFFVLFCFLIQSSLPRILFP